MSHLTIRFWFLPSHLTIRFVTSFGCIVYPFRFLSWSIDCRTCLNFEVKGFRVFESGPDKVTKPHKWMGYVGSLEEHCAWQSSKSGISLREGSITFWFQNCGVPKIVLLSLALSGKHVLNKMHLFCEQLLEDSIMYFIGVVLGTSIDTVILLWHFQR